MRLLGAQPGANPCWEPLDVTFPAALHGEVRAGVGALPGECKGLKGEVTGPKSPS